MRDKPTLSRNHRPLVLMLMVVAAVAPAVQGAEGEEICHVPDDPRGRIITLKADEGTLAAHREHAGDYRGACGSIPDDRDADGVLDWLDNCLERRNTAQRDTDRDGFGNACDPDFDNDGKVDAEDERSLLMLLQRDKPVTREERIRARDFDLDGNGALDRRDLRILRSFLRRPPGPRLDSDGDGTADMDDPCPETLPGTRPLVPGCSALDLVERPGALADPVRVAIGEVVGQLRPNPVMRKVVVDLDAATELLSAGMSATSAGDPCGGRERFSEAERRLTYAFRRMGEVLARARSAVTVSNIQAGDVTEDDLRISGLAVLQQMIGSARTEAAGAAAALRTVSSVAQPLEARGLVRDVHDRQRRIELVEVELTEDGVVRSVPELEVGLSRRVNLEGVLSTGLPAVVLGIHFRDGTALGTDVLAQNPDPSDAQVSPCLRLRFAPIQLFPPFTSGPLLLHHPNGYRIGQTNEYRIESGMRVAVESTCPVDPTDPIELEFKRYTAKITMDYTDWDGNARIGESVASDLDQHDDPVHLPNDVDPAAPALLHVEHSKQICQQGLEQTCGNKTLVATVNYPLDVRPRGDLCTAEYLQTIFNVDDRMPDDRRLATTVSVGSWPLAQFEAEAYAICPGQVSCAPQVSTISGGQPFVIHNFDFYPIHRPGSLGSALAAIVTGVTRAAGLRWPRVRGMNGSFEFQYSCTVPAVVRDAVNLCSRSETHKHDEVLETHTTDVHAFYRLPFLATDTGWSQNQANLPPCPAGCDSPEPEECEGNATCTRPSHFGGYALDMVTTCDNDIRAARAGRVIALTESNSGQWDGNCSTCLAAEESSCCPAQGHSCCTSWCPGNDVYVRHQDETIGQYVHMPEDGVVPEVGDLVRRGELLGWVGVTGSTRAPHLHLAERALVADCCTHLMLFEAVDPADETQLLECYEPMNGDVLRSNNTWP